ncbi:MAG: NUDIX hydrolase [Acidobacteriota bacterium]
MTSKTTRSKADHKLIYEGRVFNVERDRVVLPNGMRTTMEIVRHRGSVVLIPQPRRGQVILIRQFRYVLNRWIWELPAGTLEAGERTDRAARRECEEEIGLRPTRIKKVGSYYPTPGFCDEHMTFYLCTGLVRPAKPAQGDEDEDIEPRTFTMARAWSLVRSGEIVDMKTVLGLAMLDRRVPVVGA